jgi:3-oxoacyl-(acyl-carrier-protein) synthase
MVGHSLSAAGSIEMVAGVLQLKYNFAHANLNLEDPIPEIVDMIGTNNLPTKKVDREINTIAKANFGFGDVNSCLIISKYNA